jgi:sugar lactone lactonase YvrE
MLILPVTTAEGEAIRNHIADCWRNYAEVPLQNRASETVFYRFTSTVAQNTLAAAPLVQQHTRSAATHLSIEKAHALTVAPDGSLFVLVTAPPQVIHYSPQGQRLVAFSLSQKYPIALAIDDQERLIVAGGEQKLVWYDLKGQIIQETLARRDLARPFSLAVLAGGELIVSDIERRQLVRISAQGTLLAEISLPELVLPGALVLSADQESVWVYDAQAGSLLEISLQNHQLLRQISSPLTDPADIVALLLLPNQHFLQTSPHRRRLIETDAQGELIRIWSGFDQPAALAANSANQLFVLDRRLEQVHIVSTGYPVPFNAHARDAATTALQSSTAQRDQPQSPLSPLTPPTGERD